ncbi:MAG: hypothetical protein ACLQUY_29110 [Ktedonobacterales bacterium]
MEAAFDQALILAMTPEEEADTWYFRGNAENNSDQWTAALSSFRRLAELEQNWCMPWLMQGMVLGNMGTFVDPHYHEDALVALDQALVLLSRLRTVDERVIYGLKACSLSCLGRHEEAEKCRWKADTLYRLEQLRTKGSRSRH